MSALALIAAGIWLLRQPGGDFTLEPAGFLSLAMATIPIVAAVTAVVAPRDKGTIRRVVRGFRGVNTAFEVAAAILVIVVAGLGIAVAALTLRPAGDLDTESLRATALTFAVAAAGLWWMSRAGMVPLYSVVKARPLPLTQMTIAVPRIAVFSSVFITSAAALAPSQTTWWPMAGAVVLALLGWELSTFRPSRDAGLTRLVDATIAAQEATHFGGDRLATALAILERACLQTTVGERPLVDGAVAYVIRACLERADMEERRGSPGGSERLGLRQLLSSWDDDKFYAETRKFAIALRHALVLRTPL